jgi:hypothetical protein
MKKIVVDGFSYNLLNNEVTFTNPDFDIRKLYSIINVRTNKVYYSLGIKGYGYVSFINNVLKLQYIPTDHLQNDLMSIIYEEDVKVEIQDVQLKGWDEVENKLPVGNVDTFFRDHFSNDFSNWDINADVEDFYYRMGSTDGSSHLSIIKSQKKLDSITEFVSKKSFQLPVRLQSASSISIRTLGVDFAIDLIGVDNNGNITNLDSIKNYKISSIQIISASTPILNFLFDEDLIGLNTGDIISVCNCDNTLLNIGPIPITLLSKRSFSVTYNVSNLAFKTYTSIIGELGENAFIKKIDIFNNAKYGIGHSFNFNSSSYIRTSIRDDKAIISNQITNATSISSTTINGTFANKAFTYAIKPNSIIETTISDRSVSWNRVLEGSIAGSNSLYKRHSPLPNENIRYKIRIKAQNTGNVSYSFISNIESISRVISTTFITIKTFTKHNLKRGNFISFLGVNNTLHFPNSSSVSSVNSIIDDFTFTITSTLNSSTIVSNGGAVFLYNGASSTITLINQNFTSYRITNNIVSVISPSTMSVTVGIHYHIFGTNTDLDGAVLRCCILNGQNASFEIINKTLSDTALITRNFVLIIANEFRIHLISVLDYNRSLVEISGAFGNRGDNDTSLPVMLNGSNINLPVLVAGGTIQLGGGNIQALTYGNVVSTSIQPLRDILIGTIDNTTSPFRSKISAYFLLNSNCFISIEQSNDNIIWFKSESQNASLIEFPNYVFTAVTSNGNIRTLTIPTGHTLMNGMEVLIENISAAFVISNVRLNSFDITATTFTLTTGTIVVKKNTYLSTVFSESKLIGRYIRFRVTNINNVVANLLYANYSLVF